MLKEERTDTTAKDHFCTIITLNHLDKALALLKSLQKHGQVILHILIINSHQTTLKRLGDVKEISDVRLYSPEMLEESTVGLLARLIFGKYMGQDDEIRWALKPLFVQFLVEHHIPICYCDCDLFFYDSYKFLVEKLRLKGSTRGKSIVITPHFREIRRIKNNEYRFNYKHGLYNAGFIGFGDECQEMLEWWSEMCATECTREESAWTYVDQKYLDLVPIYFENVEVLKHYGCNVAGWNTYYLKRTVGEDGKVLVNGQEIVFIHFSPATLTGIEEGHDQLLFDHYTEYQKTLQELRKMLLRAHLRNCISGTIEGQVI